MPLHKTFLSISILIIISCGIKAQIFAPAANDSVLASYGNDKVFIFNAPSFGAETDAALTAVAVNDTEAWTIQWAVYDKPDSSFRLIASPASGNVSTIDTVTVSAGYRAILNSPTVTDTFTAWVIINDLDVRITNKDQWDTLLYGYYDCASLDLHADTTKPAASYYNPDTHEKLTPGNLYTIRWTTDNPEATNPSGRLLTRVGSPPWKDTWYKLTVTDRFGLERSDSVIYNSIQSKADITAARYIPPNEDTLNHDTREWYDKFYNYDDGSKSAPALFRFDVSGSKNLENYEFTFGDGDSVLMDNDSVIFFHEFLQPGTYQVVLTTKSGPPFECMSIDSLSIKVDEASGTNFIMPNVFTPDGSDNKVLKYDEESVNNVFRTTDVSVIYIDIAIFTRTGLKVHQFDGNIRDWPGWDGKIMNSNRDAPEGVYFYVISRFVAYQNNIDPISKKLMNGFIHLYRK